jgi:hypothetical protein
MKEIRMRTHPFAAWEALLTNCVAAQLEVPYSDAAAVVEAQPAELSRAWADRLSPDAAALRISEASSAS